MSTPKISFSKYWYIIMAQAILEREDQSLENTYTLVKSIFDSHKSLGLEFEENFYINPSMSKKGEINWEDEGTVAQIKKKIKTVKKELTAKKEELDARIEAGEDLLEKSDLERNIEMVATALQFDRKRTTLLLFFACMGIGRFGQLIEACAPESPLYEDYIKAIGFLLGENPEDIREELAPENTLMGIEFLEADEKSIGVKQPHRIGKGLHPILKGNFKSPKELLHSLLGPHPKTELDASNYAFMGRQFEDMKRTMEGHVNSDEIERKNMTLVGPPGTGKTEITRVLANEIGVDAFLIGTAKKVEGTGYSIEEPTRDDRIRALIRAAYILRQTKMKAILVFDEAEDILRDLNSKSTKETGSKAFTNDFLENLGVPTIFISNRPDLFDPATTRRIMPLHFMHYMPFPERIRAIKQKAQRYIETDLDENDLENLAEISRQLPVAIIDTCLRSVGKRAEKGTDPKTVIAEIRNEINDALTAAHGGIPPLPVDSTDGLDGFNPELISASTNVPALREQFTRSAGNGNLAGLDIVIVGPHGTGRKSIARYLATATGKHPKVIPLSLGQVMQYPDKAHAMDLEYAKLDGNVLIFEGATKFLQIAHEHPLMERIRHHPLPTFFIGEIDDNGKTITPSDFDNFTFTVRTGYLTNGKLRKGCKDILHTDFSEVALNKVPNMGIGTLKNVGKKAKALGIVHDDKAVLKLLEEVTAYADPIGKGSNMLFKHSPE